MIDITRFAELVPGDHGLAVVALALPDQTVHASVANAGVLSHPTTGAPVVGIVAGGNSRKLHHLRNHPRATVLLRAGWRWAAVEGPVELAGPDDPLDGIDAERLRLLLREVYTAAGGYGRLALWPSLPSVMRARMNPAEVDVQPWVTCELSASLRRCLPQASRGYSGGRAGR